MNVCWRACWRGELPPADDLYESAPDWLADALTGMVTEGVAPSERGLYLATADAGAQASVAMWAEALTAGPGFANPRPFPWTLASSPAGHLAQRLGIRGPVYVLVGGAGALTAAFDHALADMRHENVGTALVVGLDLPAQASSGGALGAALSLAPGNDRAAVRQSKRSREAKTGQPGQLLSEMVMALERGGAAGLSAPGEGSISLESRRPGG